MLLDIKSFVAAAIERPPQLAPKRAQGSTAQFANSVPKNKSDILSARSKRIY